MDSTTTLKDSVWDSRPFFCQGVSIDYAYFRAAKIAKYSKLYDLEAACRSLFWLSAVSVDLEIHRYRRIAYSRLTDSPKEDLAAHGEKESFTVGCSHAF